MLPWQHSDAEGAEVGLRDNVAVLTLNRPPENALSHVFRAEIAAALKAAMASPAKALFVTGREPHFAAGAGISEPCDGLVRGALIHYHVGRVRRLQCWARRQLG